MACCYCFSSSLFVSLWLGHSFDWAIVFSGVCSLSRDADFATRVASVLPRCCSSDYDVHLTVILLLLRADEQECVAESSISTKKE